jgi:hypothetical protein
MRIPLLTIALLPAVALGAADDLMTSTAPKPVVMAFDFASRAATDTPLTMNLRPLLMPDWSRSYMRIRAPGKARPLYVTGMGRRGSLSFTFHPDPVSRGGYRIVCAGDATVEFTGYQATPEAVGADLTGAEWARSGGKWAAAVLRLREVTPRDADTELRTFMERRYIPARANLGESTPFAYLHARADIELRSPTGSVVLRDQPADIAVGVYDTERFGRRNSHWGFTLTMALQADGRSLGLKEAGAQPLEILAVLGTAQWVPTDVRTEEAPDVEDTGVGAEGKE